MKRKITLIISLYLVLLICPILVNASDSITDTLEEGQTGTYQIEGISYVVYVTVITDTGNLLTKLSINGVVTPTLDDGDVYSISDSVEIRVDNILYCESGMCEYIDFTLYSVDLCGDGICNSGEHCSTCSQDCGCESGYECQNGDCIELPVCGDDECDDDETCEKDDCCDGNEVDFDDDYYNCGRCGKQCKGYEECDNGKCVQVCGNGYCESNEDCESCEEDCGKCICGDGICQSTEDCESCIEDCTCKSYERCELKKCTTFCGNNICESNEDCSSCQLDCRCEGGYECFNKKCVESECNINIDCDDKDECTIDTCFGTPKKCSNKRSPGCDFEDNCIPIGTKTESQYCSIENSMQNLKSEDANCNNDYECSSNICVNNQCMSPSLIQKIINWFKSLFDW